MKPNGHATRSELLMSLSPIVARLRDHVRLFDYLESLPPSMLKAARELAAHTLLHESGFCLDERNQGESMERWTLEYMNLVAIAAETIDRCEKGRYIVRTTRVELPKDVLVDAKKVRHAGEVVAPEIESAECMNAEEADGIV
jgi:hypothetical protein